MIFAPSRRHLLGGFSGLMALPVLATRARAQALDLESFGLVADSEDDQSERLQAILDAAVAEGRPVSLPAGTFYVHDLDIPGFVTLRGVPGRTLLSALGEAPIGTISAVSDLVIESIGFSGAKGSLSGEDGGLLVIDSATGITLRGCAFSDSKANGISATNAQATIEDCSFQNLDAAIHNFDGDALLIRGNRIIECANAGIRLWRSSPGRDGSIVTGNQIKTIGWAGGGNGQNGNGVSIFRADEVIVADNAIAHCAFTAVRVNAGKNTQVRGNTCSNSGEVAIFSEFEFSGSVIADNVIDGAATGIAITNLDSGGHLATCTGNIVRNITAKSEVNPDTRPVGIAAEADTVVANNVIDGVPGVGILAGYGPYVRNLVVSGNVITGVETGIGVSVVQDEAPGPVRVSGNVIGAGAKYGVAGMEWEKVVSENLAADAGRYPNVTVDGNSVG